MFLLLALKCFYCWLWIGKCLASNPFLCKDYYSKSKDKQMLYLTTFKIAAYFFNSYKFSKYLTTSSYSTYLHEKGFPAILPKLPML